MADDNLLPIPGYEGAVEIGRGGFGVVYRARQVDVQRTVAIKLLTGVFDEHARVRFDRERDAMGLLSSHPNSVTVHASGFTPDGHPYIVMEHLEGASLADRLQRGPIPWQEAVEIGIKLAGALEAAHRAGVLHRDVKPENVLISVYGEPKLADFGIARLEGGPETRTGNITASLYHAAPEVFEGKRPTYSTDVYSLASTVFALIAANAPFARGTDESIVPLFARVATEPPPDLRPLGVPDSVCAVLEAGLAKDPEQRIGTAVEFGERLQAAQRALGIDVTPMIGAPRPSPSAPADRPPTGPPQPPTMTPQPPAMTPPPQPPSLTLTPSPPAVAPPRAPGPPTEVPPAAPGRERKQPSRAVVIAGVAIVVLVAVVGGALLLGGGGGGEPDSTRLATSVAPASAPCTGTQSPVAPVSQPLAIGWQQPQGHALEGAVVASPAEITNTDQVVVGTDGGEVAGFRASTGDETFRTRVDGPVIGDPGQEGSVYLGTAAGSLYKVDLAAAASPRVTRVLKVGSPIGGVAVQGGLAYVALRSVGGGLLVVNLDEKKVVRRITTDGAVFGKPVIENTTKTVYFASTGGVVYGLPLPDSGATAVRRFPLEGRGRIEAGLAVVAGRDASSVRLVVATVDGVVRALSSTNGRQAWAVTKGTIPAGAGVFVTPAASRAANIVVVATTGCRLFALAGDSGTKLWDAALGNAIRVDPVIAGPNVITANGGCVDVWKLAPPKPPEPTAVRSLYPTKCPSFEVRSLFWDTVKAYAGTSAGQVVATKFPVTPSEVPSG
ncbi:MAG: protein kinase domain-containing protein [Acidimicrobiia bacterium]